MKTDAIAPKRVGAALHRRAAGRIVWPMKLTRRFVLKSSLGADPLSSDAFSRMATHLAANEIDLARAGVQMGPALAFDVKSETFVDNSQANALLTRKYRAPFALPGGV
jgi:hypothetical protein